MKWLMFGLKGAASADFILTTTDHNRASALLCQYANCSLSLELSIVHPESVISAASAAGAMILLLCPGHLVSSPDYMTGNGKRHCQFLHASTKRRTRSLHSEDESSESLLRAHLTHPLRSLADDHVRPRRCEQTWAQACRAALPNHRNGNLGDAAVTTLGTFTTCGHGHPVPPSLLFSTAKSSWPCHRVTASPAACHPYLITGEVRCRKGRSLLAPCPVLVIYSSLFLSKDTVGDGRAHFSALQLYEGSSALLPHLLCHRIAPL